MPGFAPLNAGVVRIGRQLAKRRNIMGRLGFDLSLEQNSPDPPEKRVQKGRSATPLIVISRFELPLLGSNQDSPDPERRPQGPKNRQNDRTWRPDEHRRPVGLTPVPLVAGETLVKCLQRVLLDSPWGKPSGESC